MPRMIAHARHLLDDARHARQRPQIGLESVGPWAAAQRAVEALEPLPIEPRLPAGSTGPPQAGRARPSPLAIPSRDALAAHVQSSGNGRQDQLAARKQPRRVPAPLLQCLEITSGRDTSVHARIIRPGVTRVTLLCEAQ
jgi:hypothetical protein